MGWLSQSNRTHRTSHSSSTMCSMTASSFIGQMVGAFRSTPESPMGNLVHSHHNQCLCELVFASEHQFAVYTSRHFWSSFQDFTHGSFVASGPQAARFIMSSVCPWRSGAFHPLVLTRGDL